MANFLYNGIELPDISEVWTDKTKYPYAFLIGTDGQYNLFYAEEPIVYNGVTFKAESRGYSWLILTTEDAFTKMCADLGLSVDEAREYGVDVGQWVVMMDGVIIGTLTSAPFWTSHDIANSLDNSVYLTASEPVPVGEVEEPTYETSYGVTSAGLIATADAIRAKTGSTEKITWQENGFADAVGAIVKVITVASVDELPTDAEDGTIALVGGV